MKAPSAITIVTKTFSPSVVSETFYYTCDTIRILSHTILLRKGKRKTDESSTPRNKRRPFRNPITNLIKKVTELFTLEYKKRLTKSVVNRGNKSDRIELLKEHNLRVGTPLCHVLCVDVRAFCWMLLKFRVDCISVSF